MEERDGNKVLVVLCFLQNQMKPLKVVLGRETFTPQVERYLDAIARPQTHSTLLRKFNYTEFVR